MKHHHIHVKFVMRNSESLSASIARLLKYLPDPREQNDSEIESWNITYVEIDSTKELQTITDKNFLQFVLRTAEKIRKHEKEIDLEAQNEARALARLRMMSEDEQKTETFNDRQRT